VQLGNVKNDWDLMFPGILGLLIDSIKHKTFPTRALQTDRVMPASPVSTEQYSTRQSNGEYLSSTTSTSY
jgi:hypothetical protein